MATKLNPPSNTGAASGTQPTRSQRAFAAVRGGIGATGSVLYSAGSDFKTRGGTVLSAVVGTPIFFVWNTIIKGCGRLVRDTLWGKKVPSNIIDVEIKGWFSKYTVKMGLDEAIKNGHTTPEKLEAENKFNKVQLRERGYEKVEIAYKTWTGKHTFNGTLKDALDSGLITIEQAIVRDLIKKEEAIAGGLLKLEKPAKNVKPSK